MEKTGRILELIIKFIFAIFSAISIVFVVRNSISMFGFLTVTNDNSAIFYATLNNTHIGKVYNSFTSLNEINLNIIHQGFVSFVSNMDVICYIFFALFVILLITYFAFMKWEIIKSYIKISCYLILTYLSKFVFILLMIAICFDGSEPSVYLALKIGTIFYYLFAMVEMFLLSLWIAKFILNLKDDFKSINNHC